MNVFSATGLVLAVMSVAACGHIARATRDIAGLSEEPVLTEDAKFTEASRDMERELRAQLVADMLVVTRGTANGTGVTTRYSLALNTLPPRVRQAFEELSDGRTQAGSRTVTAGDFVRQAQGYYAFGRNSFRSRCELFLQTLASVDGQISYGRDLGNNFFDAATILSTAFNSPAGYAIGISTTQSTFNSVYGSMERYLMLTDSVGPLRERVLEAMAQAETPAVEFGDGSDIAAEVENSRLAINQVQNYGVTCSEAGLRQIIGDALREEPTLESVTRAGRVRSLVSDVENAVKSIPGFNQYVVSDSDLYLLYAYLLSDRSNEAERRLIAAGLPTNSRNESLLTVLVSPAYQLQLNRIYGALTQLADIEPYRTQLRQGSNAVTRQAQAISPPAPPVQPLQQPAPPPPP